MSRGHTENFWIGHNSWMSKNTIFGIFFVFVFLWLKLKKTFTIEGDIALNRNQFFQYFGLLFLYPLESLWNNFDFVFIVQLV